MRKKLSCCKRQFFATFDLFLFSNPIVQLTADRYIVGIPFVHCVLGVEEPATDSGVDHGRVRGVASGQGVARGDAHCARNLHRQI